MMKNGKIGILELHNLEMEMVMKMDNRKERLCLNFWLKIQKHPILQYKIIQMNNIGKKERNSLINGSKEEKI